MQTARDTKQYAVDLGYSNEEEFIDDIKGKRILDAGSGHGGFE